MGLASTGHTLPGEERGLYRGGHSSGREGLGEGEEREVFIEEDTLQGGRGWGRGEKERGGGRQ